MGVLFFRERVHRAKYEGIRVGSRRQGCSLALLAVGLSAWPASDAPAAKAMFFRQMLDVLVLTHDGGILE